MPWSLSLRLPFFCPRFETTLVPCRCLIGSPSLYWPWQQSVPPLPPRHLPQQHLQYPSSGLQTMIPSKLFSFPSPSSERCPSLSDPLVTFFSLNIPECSQFRVTTGDNPVRFPPLLQIGQRTDGVCEIGRTGGSRSAFLLFGGTSRWIG